MRRVSIRIKLAFPAVALSCLLCGVLFFTTNHGFNLFQQYILGLSHDLAMDGYKREMKSATEIAASTISAIFSNQNLSQEEKLEQSKELVRKLRFGEDGYYYAYQRGTGFNIIHGANASLEGTSLWDLQSPDKKQYIIRDLDKAAENNSIFVEFFWEKPGAEKNTVYPKLGTAMMVPGTDMWVGTGTYIDEIDATLANIDTSLSQFAYQTQRQFLIISIIVPGLFILILMMGITSITRPLLALSRFFEESKGVDFTIDPPVSRRKLSDEISDLEANFRTLYTQFGEILKEVKENVQQSEILSSSMNRGSLAISESSETVKDSMDSIATAANQLDGEAKANLNLCADLEVFISENSKLAKTQTEYAEKVLNDIVAINDDQDKILNMAEELNSTAGNFHAAAESGAGKVLSAVHNLEAAERSAAAIGEVIDLINNIADRTHILSMNAAIQAAHAGASGKGFAVVANEIRKLAQSSRDNSQKITQSLTEIAQSIQTSMKSTKEVQLSFSTINSGSETVKKSTEIIAQSSSALTESGNRINQALKELGENARIVDSSSQDATRKVSDLAQSSDELSSLSGNLDSASTTLKNKMHTISSETREITALTAENEKNTARIAGTVSRFKT